MNIRKVMHNMYFLGKTVAFSVIGVYNALNEIGNILGKLK